MDTTGVYTSFLRNMRITPNTILLGDESVAFHVVTCARKFSNPQASAPRAVFEAHINGIPCVAKCWHSDLTPLFNTECMVYERLTAAQAVSANVFAKLIGWGRVVCSSLFPTGNTLVLEKRPGQVLSDVWPHLNLDERNHIQNECMKAIGMLRSISIRLADAGKHNVLFDRETRTVTLIDFEHIGFCEYPEDTTSLEPEMSAIFGDEEGWVWWVQV